MQKLPRAERRYRVTEGRLVESAAPAPVAVPASRKRNHAERHSLMRAARHAVRHIGTTPRSKVHNLEPVARALWHEQRADSRSSFYASRDWARFGWLCLNGLAVSE
jgi:hypothetical protein